MTNEEMIAVLQAHMDGETIQFGSSEGFTDVLDDTPGWNFSARDYRVKPKEPRVIYVEEFRTAGLSGSHKLFKCNAEKGKRDSSKIVKFVEVVE